ncbi:TIGR03086 family metal-binding protein [Streptomyces sp. NPDC059853]|uniref:TIGR03086 family metal-binding protein n=1 Tax=Streptomyces sp. NPDC059853 TaxID=3346973 RepID=UPI003646D944
MRLTEAYERAQAEFDRRVRRVGAGQWSAPTPCTAWSVRDLVGHLTAEQLWAPHLLRGETLAEVGDRYDGDVLGEDPVAAWERAARGAREAFAAPGALEGTVHTSGGPTPAEEYARQMTLDLAVHAWDLARGIAADDRLDEEVAATVYGFVAPQIDGWQGLGIFDPPVEVARDAPVQDRLVALLGRDPAR